MKNKAAVSSIGLSIFFKLSLCIGISGAVFPGHVVAQTRSMFDGSADPRGEPELTVCSQNLKNYSIPKSKPKKAEDADSGSDATEKEEALISRFVFAKCDVVGVQEVNGPNDEAAKDTLRRLASLWRKKTGRPFDVQVGSANTGTQRTGVIVARDRAEIVNTISYREVLLPKIDDNQKNAQFPRSPVEVQLLVKGKGDAPNKNISLIIIHFKSKSASMGDPVGIEWETKRMEMAEAIRRLIESRYHATLATGDDPFIVMGDRNSNFDSASAKILEGALNLEKFKGKAPCRLSKRGVPLCQAGTEASPSLFSVLTNDPQTKKSPGTFIYKKIYSWIDEILLPETILAMARTDADVEGDYDSGVVWQFPDASDHALVYVRLNW